MTKTPKPKTAKLIIEIKDDEVSSKLQVNGKVEAHMLIGEMEKVKHKLVTDLSKTDNIIRDNNE